jgi:hypothetical protein
MKRRSELWLRRGWPTVEKVLAEKPTEETAFAEYPTVETVFAEYEELLSSLSCSRINCTIKDAVSVAKGFFGEAVRRELRRSKLEDSTLGKHGRQRTQEAKQRKREAQAIAARLLREQRVLRLPRKKSELALRVHKELAKYGGKPPASRTVRRWIDEMIPPKK